MASVNFTSLVTVIPADWANEVDALVHDILSAPTSAADVRTALNLVVGVDVQAYDATILNADDIGVTVQGYDATILDAADIGVSVQAQDAGLTSIASLTTAADKMVYTTALDTYAVTPLTAAGRALLDDASAGAQRTTLGAAASGANADITSIAALTGSGTLSNYEEGTFAAKLQDSSFSDGEGQTYNYGTGNYTRIGNRVFFNLRVWLNSKGTLSGSSTFIANLPIASAATDSCAVAVGLVNNANLTAGYNISGYVVTGTTRINLTVSDLAGGTSNLLISEINTGFDIYISGNYEV